MAAAYRSASANGGAGNIVVTRPTGVVNNDVLLAFVRAGFQNTITAPAGWTQFRNDTLSANHSFQAYWKVANNEPASESWTNVSGSNGSVIVIATSGVHTTNPLHQNVFTTTAVDGDEIDAPSVTTTIDGCLILRIGTEWGNGSWPATHTWASGATKILDHQFQSTAHDNALLSPAGASGTRRLLWGHFVGATLQGALTLALAPGVTDVAIAGSDPATMSESASVTSIVSFSGTDSLVQSESAAPSASMDRSDTWTLSEALAIATSLTVSDSATQSDPTPTVSEQAVKEVSDSATQGESASVLTTLALAANDTATQSEEAVALSVAVSAAESHITSELLSIAATLSRSDAVALTEAAATLQTLFLAGSDSATQSEAAALAHHLSASDAATFSETVDSVGGMMVKTAFDSLVLIGEQAVVSGTFSAPSLTLPTSAAVRMWATLVLLGVSTTSMDSDGTTTAADLDDMLTAVTLLTTE